MTKSTGKQQPKARVAMSITTKDHSTLKGDVRLFMRQKQPAAGENRGTILFVHGSTWAGLPTFDLAVPGRANSSVLEFFAGQGFDAWCVDNEGYGLSDKSRQITCDVANGADDLEAAVGYIQTQNGGRAPMIYGISSGALKAALLAQRHPAMVSRLVLDAFVWTGENSPTLIERRKKLDYWSSRIRRPIDLAYVHSVFNRDHPGVADEAVIVALANATLAQGSEVPTGSYIDMCAHLPLVDPRKIAVPTGILRGEFDGVAAYEDVRAFFDLLPNQDKMLTIMPGIAHASFQEKNYMTVLHYLLAFVSAPPAIYR
jgi:pimeloyl-ACP methyl ester carboxylesterase